MEPQMQCIQLNKTNWREMQMTLRQTANSLETWQVSLTKKKKPLSSMCFVIISKLIFNHLIVIN